MPLIICFTAQYYNEHQLSWGKLRCEPATRWFDESFAPIPKSCERFARQHRYRPPPGFPRASSCSGIVHHLSGPNRHTQAQPKFETNRPAGVGHVKVCTPLVENLPFSTRDGTWIILSLARLFDSLVRVSRRVEAPHFLYQVVRSTGK